jgi:hypothetical protein
VDIQRLDSITSPAVRTPPGYLDAERRLWMQSREDKHEDKDERHRGQQDIAGFDRQAGGIGASWHDRVAFGLFFAADYRAC